MRYIEQDDDIENLLEPETQVRPIRTHEQEEGGIVDHDKANSDVRDLHMHKTWDDYGVLAMRQKKGTPGYKIPVEICRRSLKFMMNTGSPASFIDHTTAMEFVRGGHAEMRELKAD